MTISDVPTTALPAEGEVAIVDIGSLTLENGAVIDDVSIAVQRWGELSPNRDNVVVVLHALTGDSHITGPAGPGQPTPGWWDGVAGPGAPIDTDRWCAVATNVLGGCRGSTGPSSLARDGKPPKGAKATSAHVLASLLYEQAAADPSKKTEPLTEANAVIAALHGAAADSSADAITLEMGAALAFAADDRAAAQPYLDELVRRFPADKVTTNARAQLAFVHLRAGKNADAAMYRAKEAGRNLVRV